MELTVKVEQVMGGYEVFVGPPVTPGHKGLAERAIASTSRQAGIRASELIRKAIEAEYLETANK